MWTESGKTLLTAPLLLWQNLPLAGDLQGACSYYNKGRLPMTKPSSSAHSLTRSLPLSLPRKGSPRPESSPQALLPESGDQRWARMAGPVAQALTRLATCDKGALLLKIEKAIRTADQARNGDAFTLAQILLQFDNLEKALSSIYYSTGPGKSIDLRPAMEDLVCHLIDETRALVDKIRLLKKLEKRAGQNLL